ncbi:unnamed protein product [Amoebophrya sp. A25]|nr:unnamed protein product [Amoebophrya sp. A25]|eukprot:GSA25T00003935001.1
MLSLLQKTVLGWLLAVVQLVLHSSTEVFATYRGELPACTSLECPDPPPAPPTPPNATSTTSDASHQPNVCIFSPDSNDGHGGNYYVPASCELRYNGSIVFDTVMVEGVWSRVDLRITAVNGNITVRDSFFWRFAKLEFGSNVSSSGTAVVADIKEHQLAQVATSTISYSDDVQTEQGARSRELAVASGADPSSRGSASAPAAATTIIGGIFFDYQRGGESEKFLTVEDVSLTLSPPFVSDVVLNGTKRVEFRGVRKWTISGARNVRLLHGLFNVLDLFRIEATQSVDLRVGLYCSGRVMVDVENDVQFGGVVSTFLSPRGGDDDLRQPIVLVRAATIILRPSDTWAADRLAIFADESAVFQAASDYYDTDVRTGGDRLAELCEQEDRVRSRREDAHAWSWTNYMSAKRTGTGAETTSPIMVTGPGADSSAGGATTTRPQPSDLRERRQLRDSPSREVIDFCHMWQSPCANMDNEDAATCYTPSWYAQFFGDRKKLFPTLSVLEKDYLDPLEPVPFDLLIVSPNVAVSAKTKIQAQALLFCADTLKMTQASVSTSGRGCRPGSGRGAGASSHSELVGAGGSHSGRGGFAVKSTTEKVLPVSPPGMQYDVPDYNPFVRPAAGEDDIGDYGRMRRSRKKNRRRGSSWTASPTIRRFFLSRRAEKDFRMTTLARPPPDFPSQPSRDKDDEDDKPKTAGVWWDVSRPASGGGCGDDTECSFLERLPSRPSFGGGIIWASARALVFDKSVLTADGSRGMVSEGSFGRSWASGGGAGGNLVLHTQEKIRGSAYMSAKGGNNACLASSASGAGGGGLVGIRWHPVTAAPASVVEKTTGSGAKTTGEGEVVLEVARRRKLQQGASQDEQTVDDEDEHEEDVDVELSTTASSQSVSLSLPQDEEGDTTVDKGPDSVIRILVNGGGIDPTCLENPPAHVHEVTIHVSGGQGLKSHMGRCPPGLSGTFCTPCDKGLWSDGGAQCEACDRPHTKDGRDVERFEWVSTGWQNSTCPYRCPPGYPGVQSNPQCLDPWVYTMTFFGGVVGLMCIGSILVVLILISLTCEEYRRKRRRKARQVDYALEQLVGISGGAGAAGTASGPPAGASSSTAGTPGGGGGGFTSFINNYSNIFPPGGSSLYSANFGSAHNSLKNTPAGTPSTLSGGPSSLDNSKLLSDGVPSGVLILSTPSSVDNNVRGAGTNSSRPGGGGGRSGMTTFSQLQAARLRAGRRASLVLHQHQASASPVFTSGQKSKRKGRYDHENISSSFAGEGERLASGSSITGGILTSEDTMARWAEVQIRARNWANPDHMAWNDVDSNSSVYMRSCRRVWNTLVDWARFLCVSCGCYRSCVQSSSFATGFFGRRWRSTTTRWQAAPEQTRAVSGGDVQSNANAGASSSSAGHSSSDEQSHLPSSNVLAANPARSNTDFPLSMSPGFDRGHSIDLTGTQSPGAGRGRGSFATADNMPTSPGPMGDVLRLNDNLTDAHDFLSSFVVHGGAKEHRRSSTSVVRAVEAEWFTADATTRSSFADPGGRAMPSNSIPLIQITPPEMFDGVAQEVDHLLVQNAASSRSRRNQPEPATLAYGEDVLNSMTTTSTNQHTTAPVVRSSLAAEENMILTEEAVRGLLFNADDVPYHVRRVYFRGTNNDSLTQDPWRLDADRNPWPGRVAGGRWAVFAERVRHELAARGEAKSVQFVTRKVYPPLWPWWKRKQRRERACRLLEFINIELEAGLHPQCRFWNWNTSGGSPSSSSSFYPGNLGLTTSSSLLSSTLGTSSASGGPNVSVKFGCDGSACLAYLDFLDYDSSLYDWSPELPPGEERFLPAAGDGSYDCPFILEVTDPLLAQIESIAGSAVLHPVLHQFNLGARTIGSCKTLTEAWEASRDQVVERSGGSCSRVGGGGGGQEDHDRMKMVSVPTVNSPRREQVRQEHATAMIMTRRNDVDTNYSKTPPSASGLRALPGLFVRGSDGQEVSLAEIAPPELIQELTFRAEEHRRHQPGADARSSTTGNYNTRESKKASSSSTTTRGGGTSSRARLSQVRDEDDIDGSAVARDISALLRDRAEKRRRNLKVVAGDEDSRGARADDLLDHGADSSAFSYSFRPEINTRSPEPSPRIGSSTREQRQGDDLATSYQTGGSSSSSSRQTPASSSSSSLPNSLRSTGGAPQQLWRQFRKGFHRSTGAAALERLLLWKNKVEDAGEALRHAGIAVAVQCIPDSITEEGKVIWRVGLMFEGCQAPNIATPASSSKLVVDENHQSRNIAVPARLSNLTESSRGYSGDSSGGYNGWGRGRAPGESSASMIRSQNPGGPSSIFQGADFSDPDMLSPRASSSPKAMRGECRPLFLTKGLPEEVLQPRPKTSSIDRNKKESSVRTPASASSNLQPQHSPRLGGGLWGKIRRSACGRQVCSCFGKVKWSLTKSSFALKTRARLQTSASRWKRALTLPRHIILQNRQPILRIRSLLILVLYSLLFADAMVTILLANTFFGMHPLVFLSWFLLPPLCPLMVPLQGVAWLLFAREEKGRIFCHLLSASVLNLYAGVVAWSFCGISRVLALTSASDDDDDDVIPVLGEEQFSTLGRPPPHNIASSTAGFERYFARLMSSPARTTPTLPEPSSRPYVVIPENSNNSFFFDHYFHAADAYYSSFRYYFLALIIFAAEVFGICLLKVALGVAANYYIAGIECEEIVLAEEVVQLSSSYLGGGEGDEQGEGDDEDLGNGQQTSASISSITMTSGGRVDERGAPATG